MAQGKKSKAGDNSSLSQLIEAVTFCKSAIKEDGEMFQQIVIMRQRQMLAFDGVLAAGHPITDDIEVCPQGEPFLAALSQCKGVPSFKLDANVLTIAAPPFRAKVLCVDPVEVTPFHPDPPVAPLTDAFREALAKVAPLCQETGKRLLEFSLLLQDGSLVGSNGHVILEAWHGNSMPNGIVIPKAFATAILKVKKELSGFGFNSDMSTLTVHFKDRSWIRTQTYAEKWPDLSGILTASAEEMVRDLKQVPAGFWEGVSAVEKFAKDGMIYVSGKTIAGGDARYEIEGMDESATFSLTNLKLISDHAEHMMFNTTHKCHLIFGKNVRGAISKVI